MRNKREETKKELELKEVEDEKKIVDEKNTEKIKKEISKKQNKNEKIDKNVKNKKEVKKDKNKRLKKRIIIIAISVITLICLSFIIFEVYQNTKTKNTYKKIEKKVEKVKEKKVEVKKSDMMLKLEEAQKVNQDVKAWIQIDGTNINYPVLQAKDNDYYISHDYKKEYSRDGSLFLDKSYDFSIPSSNLLIYGHNNNNNLMFCDLMKYKKEDFYKEHPTIKYTTNTEDTTYEIIAVFLSRVYYKSETNVFRYYYFVNAESEMEYNNYVQNSKKASLYDTGKTASFGDQLLTLSTCSYHTEDGRLAVVARKVK